MEKAIFCHNDFDKYNLGDVFSKIEIAITNFKVIGDLLLEETKVDYQYLIIEATQFLSLEDSKKIELKKKFENSFFVLVGEFSDGYFHMKSVKEELVDEIVIVPFGKNEALNLIERLKK